MTPLYAKPPLAVARVNDPFGLRRGRALLLELAFELRAELGTDPCSSDRLLLAALADPVGVFVHGPSSLLVATDSGRDVGVAVVRPHADGTAEIGHLYVRPSARGTGVGRALVQAALVHCRAAGHRSVWADVAAEMTDPVQALGSAFGFKQTADGSAALLLGCCN